jgi:hypothetical protein
MTGLVFLIAACSGGSGGPPAKFTVTSVTPNSSADANGGEVVTITGTNFKAARVAQVIFGTGNPGFNFKRLSDTELEVTVPPSPSGLPGTVFVDVVSLEMGTRGVPGGFTYAGGGGPTGPPEPETITPTTFTATGAEKFTIGGKNLGPGGGTVDVEFLGVGRVRATVSADGKFAIGNAPITAGVPPTVASQVMVDSAGQTAPVPTQVSYFHLPPVVRGLGYQEGNGNASQPVRVADGLAVMATSGPDPTWTNGNDSLFLVVGPPFTGPPVDLLAAQAAGMRNLDPNNSIPIALDSDTICVYTRGPNPAPANGDETILLITNLQGTPSVVALAAPLATQVPIARISSTLVAFTVGGTGTNGQDQLQILEIVNGVFVPNPVNRVDIGYVDGTATRGRANRSIPYSPDGDTVFVFSLGLTGTLSTADDSLARHVISTGFTSIAQTPLAVTAPVVLSPTRAVAPVSGSVLIPASANDQLAAYDFITPNPTTTLLDTGSRVNAGAVRPMVKLGDSSVVLSLGGPGLGSPSKVGVFVDDGTGGFTQTNLDLSGRPHFVRLLDGSVILFGPGAGGAPGTPDDRTMHVPAAGLPFQDFFSPPLWSQATLATSDDTRAFAIGDGLDGFTTTGDEKLLVFQSKSLGTPASASTLPMATGLNVPVRSVVGAGRTSSFVPVGPGWGLMQSPGRNGTFNNADDPLILVYY